MEQYAKRRGILAKGPLKIIGIAGKKFLAYKCKKIHLFEVKTDEKPSRVFDGKICTQYFGCIRNRGINFGGERLMDGDFIVDCIPTDNDIGDKTIFIKREDLKNFLGGDFVQEFIQVELNPKDIGQCT